MTTGHDPWARYRDPSYAEARAGQVLCGFHSANPDVGDDVLGEYCPDCEVERYFDELHRNYDPTLPEYQAPPQPGSSWLALAGRVASRVVLCVIFVVSWTLGRQLVRDDPPPVAPLVPRAVDELLAELRVEPETDSATYRRDAFGEWVTGPDGCDTRAQVLIDESLTPANVGSDCDVTAGEWVSLYDGSRTNDPADLEVDHLVALAEAWESGAAAWTPQRRHDFANDTTHPDALIAVSAATNRAKSDRDPTAWLPRDDAAWCRYALAWITTKVTWDLAVDEAEHAALTIIVAVSCPAELAPGAVL